MDISFSFYITSSKTNKKRSFFNLTFETEDKNVGTDRDDLQYHLRIMNSPFKLIIIIGLLFVETNAYRGDFMTSVRDSYKRYDPDATLNGFLPFWGLVLFGFSFLFLLIAGVGLIGYFIGCRSPPDSLRQPLDPSTLYP